MSKKIENRNFLLAKEKGFISEKDINPTQSDIQKWLRETHFIIVESTLDCIGSHITKGNLKFHPMIYTYSEIKSFFWMYTDFINSDECTDEMQETMPIFQSYNTFEEALEIAIEEGLKLL